MVRRVYGRIRRVLVRVVLAPTRKREWSRLRSSRGHLLDIGGGVDHLPGWVCLDLNPGRRALPLDAAKLWPLPNGCARAVRSEHMLEHLTFDEAGFCVREMHRVLEPGGVCRICTPDLEGIARVYLGRDETLLGEHRSHGYYAPTWSHLPNNYMRLWGHQHLFDFAALQQVLADAGFAEIERTPFNRSRHPVLDGTDSHDAGALNEINLCVDAVKPR